MGDQTMEMKNTQLLKDVLGLLGILLTIPFIPAFMWFVVAPIVTVTIYPHSKVITSIVVILAFLIEIVVIGEIAIRLGPKEI